MRLPGVWRKRLFTGFSLGFPELAAVLRPMPWVMRALLVILLAGISRVGVVEVESSRLYRQVAVEPLAEQPVDASLAGERFAHLNTFRQGRCGQRHRENYSAQQARRRVIGAESGNLRKHLLAQDSEGSHGRDNQRYLRR